MPQRHLLLGTQKQLDLFACAKRWYVDGTFKVVCEPFTQLWSIHVFVSSDGVTKQIPLVCVLMRSYSGRQQNMSSPMSRSMDVTFRGCHALWTGVPLESGCLEESASHWTKPFLSRMWRGLHIYPATDGLNLPTRRTHRPCV